MILAMQHEHDFVVQHPRMTAAAVLAPGMSPFTVGKRSTVFGINHFHFSTGPLNERLLRGTARQHDITLTGVLQQCDGCLETKSVRSGVPRRTISRVGRPMETVHIDLAGSCEASMGGSHYLIIFIDSTSRWVRLYGMMRKLQTTLYVQTFPADMNALGRPLCYRADNGGEFTSRSYIVCDSAAILREHTAPHKPQQKAWSRV